MQLCERNLVEVGRVVLRLDVGNVRDLRLALLEGLPVESLEPGVVLDVLCAPVEVPQALGRVLVEQAADEVAALQGNEGVKLRRPDTILRKSTTWSSS